MKCALLFATLASIAVPATAGPLEARKPAPQRFGHMLPNEIGWGNFHVDEQQGSGSGGRKSCKGGASAGTATVSATAEGDGGQTGTPAQSDTEGPTGLAGLAAEASVGGTEIVNTEIFETTTSAQIPAGSGTPANGPVFPFEGDETMMTESSTPEDIAGTTKLSKLALDYHNQYRAQFDSPAMEWDPELAQQAADHMKACQWEHFGSDVLSMIWTSSSEGANFVGLIRLWANEYQHYDYNNPGFKLGTGHFTAMVWKANTKVGCGWAARCPNDSTGKLPQNVDAGNDAYMMSCIYNGTVPVNLVTKQAENVPQLGGELIGVEESEDPK